MAAKFTAWFSTGSGWILVLTFIGAGITAISTHFTGSIAADLTALGAFIGLLSHPTNMTAGKSVPSYLK